MSTSFKYEKIGAAFFKYRSSIPLLLMPFALFFAYQSSKKIYPINYSSFIFLALVLNLIGLAIRSFTVGYSAKNTSGRNTQRQVADSLNTKGIYSLTRNPLYLGNFLMWLGIAVLSTNSAFVFAFVVFFFVFYFFIIKTEEAFLTNKFGTTYLSWKKEVPVFFPKLWNYKKPETAFNWKKVLAKEKNGFAAIFVTIYVFAMVNAFGHPKFHLPPFNNLWFYLAIFGMIVYFVLRHFKRKWRNEI